MLGNWDVVGNGFDNVVVGANGKAYRIDNGGSLRFRAQGAPKGDAWNGYPSELWSMRSSSSNTNTASVFGSLTYREVMGQARELVGKKADILKAATDLPVRKTLDARLKTMDFLAKDFDRLTKAKQPENTIEAFHKELIERAKSGTPLPKTQKEAKALYDDFVAGKAPTKNLPGVEIDPTKPLSDGDVQTLGSKLNKSSSAAQIAKQWQKKLDDPDWKKANNAPPPPPPGAVELGAIGAYTGSSYVDINKTLRGVIAEKGKHVEVATLATSGMSHLPSYGKTSYRGTNLKPEHLAQYQVGQEYLDVAFGSTSKTEAGAWSGNTYIIYQPKKSGGVGKDVVKFSLHPNEDEVLYPPNARFRVTSKQENVNCNHVNGKIYKHVIVLEEL